MYVFLAMFIHRLWETSWRKLKRRFINWNTITYPYWKQIRERRDGHYNPCILCNAIFYQISLSDLVWGFFCYCYCCCCCLFSLPFGSCIYRQRQLSSYLAQFQASGFVTPLPNSINIIPHDWFDENYFAGNFYNLRSSQCFCPWCCSFMLILSSKPSESVYTILNFFKAFFWVRCLSS